MGGGEPWPVRAKQDPSFTNAADPAGATAAPDWRPDEQTLARCNVAWLMRRAGQSSYPALHAWSAQHRAEYWRLAIERLGIRFPEPFRSVLDASAGVEAPCWLPGARLNIVESCFSAPPEEVAIVHQSEGGALGRMTYGELCGLAARVAAALRHSGRQPGDAVAILLPMHPEAVAIYLGIIAAGCVAVGIADSFRPREIAARLRLSEARAIFTQDAVLRGGKTLPLYAKAMEPDSPPAIVLRLGVKMPVSLRPGDIAWQDFLGEEAELELAPCAPPDPLNILFSSGTTGDPKVIPWTHTTPIKCAADAHFHQDVHPGDVLAWPTNLGWMMGPWLIYASLLNQAGMALYDGAPTGAAFCRFIQDAGVTMLGVIPSLVKVWRANACTEGVDWSGIRVFSSTGECSNADDMRWLMRQAGGRPVIEYCGGTEIGGGYITGTVALPCIAGEFNTPALGLDVALLDDSGRPADRGEMFLLPPSIGLSTTLLNHDHHQVYFADVPRGPHGETLRRHGDQMERTPSGGWRALGRADDTMNLGGIKVSSTEIERVVQTAAGVSEAAAIAVSDGGGPSQLVIFAVCSSAAHSSREDLLASMQRAIKEDLNPLFKIHDLVLVPALPRTSSQKIMRRVLRAQYAALP